LFGTLDAGLDDIEKRYSPGHGYLDMGLAADFVGAYSFVHGGWRFTPNLAGFGQGELGYNWRLREPYGSVVVGVRGEW